MKILAYVTVGLQLVALAPAAVAQVTQSYNYDASGRLTGVVTTGGAGTHTSAYVYDRANNRVLRGQSGSTAWAAISRLPTGRLLQPDEALVSPDGRYSFALRPSGQLELWSGEALAASGSGSLATAFRLTGDGQAHFLPPLQAEGPPDGASLALTDDGDLALLDQAGSEIWRSGDAIDQETAR